MAEPTDDLEPSRATTPYGAWRRRISASRKRREDLIAEWQNNVTRRRGQHRRTTDAYDRINVSRAWDEVSINQDWPLTKAKIAQLYSQTPQIRLTPRRQDMAAAAPVFGRIVNDTIRDANVGGAVEEVLADVVNAAGIGAVLVSCEKRTEPREVPLLDPATLPPDMQQAVLAGEVEIPTETVEHPVDIRYPVCRISPADLLVPSDFTGSDYDQCRWLGHEGRMVWAQAMRELGLTEEQREEVLGEDKRQGGTSNTLNADQQKFRDTEVVNFTEVYYWRHYYHAEETNFSAIQRVVFVDGLEEPVIDEEYVGQQRTETGMVGVVKLPIRVLTLTYISDESLPPSDSSVARFQVLELEASRDAMVQQRRHSIPIRWFNPSLVSPNVKSLIEKGDFQGFIPVLGSGERAVGEVARASFPSERFEFDKVIKSDLTEIWQVGTNQAGAFASGERSASEAKIIQQNFNTRVGQERDKVTKFFVGIAENLAGLIALYGQFELSEEHDQVGDEGMARLETFDRAMLAGAFTYSVRVDSTVLLDAESRIEQLQRFLNLTAESGYTNPKPVIEEMAELSGLDPAKVVIDPQPKPPEPVKVSVGSAEDVMNPLMLALLMRTGQAGSPEDLAAAVKAIQQALSGVITPPMGGGGAPPAAAPPPDAVARPEFDSAPRIDRRQEDFGA